MNQPVLITIFHLYTPATINALERWLSKKAEMGWRLEDMHGWKFVFRKCNPYKTQFVYYSGFGQSLGIANDYLSSKKLYAKNKSAINKSNNAIFEVDIDKIDIGFNAFLRLRNKFYLQHYFAMLLFAIIWVVFATMLTLTNTSLAVFLAVALVLFAYALFSLLVLAYETGKTKTGDGLREP